MNVRLLLIKNQQNVPIQGNAYSFNAKGEMIE